MSWKDFLSIAVAAAPYVAAPFTGGASLALAPYAGAGAGAIKGSDQGLKGALMGGTMGLAMGSIPGAPGAAPVAGGALPTSMAAGGAAGQIGLDFAKNQIPSSIVANAAQRAAGGGGLWQHFLKNKGLEALSKMATSASTQMGADRKAAEGAQDANLRKLQQAEYIASGGAPADPYGFISPPEAGTIRAASELREKIKKQLGRRTSPGALEQVFDVAGPALGVWDQFVR